MGEIHFVLKHWKFKESKDDQWRLAHVPGCVHTDLLRHGIIPDPFYGTNERELQWIDKADWEYEAHFDVPDDVMEHSRVSLVFDGLDTYADVFLNGEKVLSADNMFRSWKLDDAKGKLKPQGNVLRVYFRSPVAEDIPKLKALGYALPASNDQSEAGGLGDQKISVFARKAPYHYGWDWGPRFVTSGIWREVRLEAWSNVRITDLFIRQDRVTTNAAELTAVAEIESEADWQGKLKISAAGLEWERDVMLAAGVNTVELKLEIPNPKLWWCRGLGEPHLYTFYAEYVQEGRTLAERSVQTGLRSVRLVREKDEAGTSFYIELNGVPVFAKGANHIPNDSFVSEVTYERYKHEIVSAVESNMNMLRVWGGGIYEQDDFYDLCDAYGLMVWQDFMFACSMYPGDEAFLNNVRIEAEENVKRLRNHPSIVLWCGNNEIDTAWSHYDEKSGWGWKQQYSPELREKIWADYEAIFHRILPEAVQRIAPIAEYWPSSPMADWTNDASQHARNDSSSGDIHYWGVWHNVEPFENYNKVIGRFMSEYGFQSFPEWETVRTYAKESDMELESEVMLQHQKNGSGNRLIRQYMEMYFPEPKDFRSFLTMSQLQQAEAMKTAIEAHRRRKPYCRGSLYWQMNDCWPVASWAGMDYYGRWKALQYTSKSSFQDVLLSMDGTGESIGFHLINDTLEEIGGSLRIMLLDFSGKLLQQWKPAASAGPNEAQVVYSLKAEEVLRGYRPEQVLLLAELEQDGQLLDSRTYYFVTAKQLELHNPTITCESVEASGGTRVLLQTDTLARYVTLSAETEGIFSDNHFDLIPGIPKVVEFRIRRSGEDHFSAAVPGELTIRSLADLTKA
ncbi:beta-mannosidase [Marinicrinis lubricantis]|uniref:Beta-mannosidase n=1 Tax=Marinicrinis lubricantis TaxID=2086470 RepID=A0ABW1ITT6_9BACL